MEMYQRYYIKINDVTNKGWSKIAIFIKIAETIKNKQNNGNSNQKALIADDIEIYSYSTSNLKHFNLLRYYNFGKKIKVIDLFNDIEKNKLINSILCDYIIIVNKITRVRDFKFLIPYTYLFETYKNVGLVIDINTLAKEDKNRFYFSLSNFLFPFYEQYKEYLERRLYIISDHFVNNKTGEVLNKGHLADIKLKTSRFSSKFSPFIEINIDTYHILFDIKLSDIICNTSEGITLDNNIISSFNSPYIDAIKVSFDRIQHKKSKNKNKLQENKNNIRIRKTEIIKEFEDEALFSFYLFITLYHQFREEKYISDEKHIKLTLHKFIDLINIYSVGIKEIVENIVFHTSKKRGYLYLLLNPVSEYLEIKRLKDIGYVENIKILKKLQRIIEIRVYDFNQIGIVPSFRSKNTKSEEDKKVVLKDFFIGKYNNFSNLSHMNLRYLAHLGLKIFSNNVINHSGFCRVETNDFNKKQELIYFSTSTGEYESIENINNLIPGTHYYLLLPVSENLIKDYIDRPINYQSRSFVNIFQNWIHHKNKKNIKYFSNFEQYKCVSKAEQEDYIAETSKKILKIIHKSYNEILVFNYKDIIDHISDRMVFLKILTYLQLTKQIKIIVIINIKPTFIRYLLNTYLDVLCKTGKIWSSKNYLYLYDTLGVPTIISGESPEDINSINTEINRYYPQKYVFQINSIINEHKKNISHSSTKAKRNLIFPYEVIIDMNFEKNNIIYKHNLFEMLITSMLNKKLEDNSIGFKLQNINMRLGSKIIVNDFYEADFLFQNSFFIDRFAFMITQSMLANYDSRKKIILIGYGLYSELLLNKIKLYLNKNTQLGCDYVICYDIEGTKWKIDIDINSLLKEKYDFQFSIIVPIGSTLTTNNKIVAEFKKHLLMEYNEIDFFLEKKIIYNCCIILVSGMCQAHLDIFRV